MPFRMCYVLPACLLCPQLAIVAFAQESKTAPEPKPAAATDPVRAETSATIEMIMETAVRNIAARYNLNEAQTEKTREIMTRDVNRFLKEHEAEVWPLIRDLLHHQLGPPDDLEDAKRIGRGALPLVQLAKEAILKGNEEWRQYLTEEQKVTHDFDLAQMEGTFDQIERNFEDWAEGRRTDRGIFDQAPVADGMPPTPKRPSKGLPSPKIETFQATVFHTHVEEFIKDYELNPAQVDAARSILKEFMVKVEDFRSANMKEFAKLGADLKAAREARDLKKQTEGELARKKLLAPVYTLFDQMDERLRALLTTAQIERHASRQGVAETRAARDADVHKQPGAEPATGEKATELEGPGSSAKTTPTKRQVPQKESPQTPPGQADSQ